MDELQTNATSRAIPGEMVLVGFAMAGFFDGILLHQVLQWHHLLSLVPAPGVQDPRVQIAADGGFHILMYLLLSIGLVLLWRRRRRALALSGKQVFGAFLLGFGLWQVVDVVFFHWILRIHHVRIAVAAPVAWDIGWLLVFAIPPLVLGWRLTAARARLGLGRSAGLSCLLAVVTLAAGLQALKPPDGANAVVLFAPSVGASQVMRGLADADARLVEISARGDLAIVQFSDRSQAWRLYRHGALLVGGAGPAGCASAVASGEPV
jgi:uncharacterized membrane protein